MSFWLSREQDDPCWEGKRLKSWTCYAYGQTCFSCICPIVKEGCDQDIRERCTDILTPGVAGKFKKIITPSYTLAKKLNLKPTKYVSSLVDLETSRSRIWWSPQQGHHIRSAKHTNVMYITTRVSTNTERWHTRYQKGDQSDHSPTSSDTNDRISLLRPQWVNGF